MKMASASARLINRRATSRRGSSTIPKRFTTSTGHGLKIPLINEKKPGKSADVTMVVAEGNLYTLRNFNFVGMKLFRTPDLIDAAGVPMTRRDVSRPRSCRKGFDELRKLYGNFGYIDFVGSSRSSSRSERPIRVDLTLDFDEGHQFFVRRIDFQGNITTRDKVIRREMLVDEGDIYNTAAVGHQHPAPESARAISNPLKPEDAATSTRDTKTNTVDLTLKVKERGKNSIQLNGGVSGISGSFIGFSYSTNNFLGLGETLSLNSQIGTLLDNVTLRLHRAVLCSTSRSRPAPRFLHALQLQPGARGIDSGGHRT